MYSSEQLQADRSEKSDRKTTVGSAEKNDEKQDTKG